MQRCKLGECKAACCLYGVWMDTAEVADVTAHASLISPHMPTDTADPVLWFDGRTESDPFSPSKAVAHTSVVESTWHYGGTACVFLRSDYKCALQVAASANGMHEWRFKPFYCILHPLDLDEEGRITLDETEHLLTEEGSCLRPAERLIPLVETFAPELRYFLGEKAFARLLSERQP